MAYKRDRSHDEQIKRWADFVRENPDKWKKHLKPFLDAQIIMANRFYKKLAQTEGGAEKIKLMRKIKEG
jgi:hypothetical protein